VTAAGSESFLFQRFRAFYLEVLKVKRELSGAAPPAAGEASERGSEMVGQRLLAYLQRQAHAATRLGGDFAFAKYGEAQYVMAALADETLLRLDWSGREAWTSNLLEEELFKTHRAGEEIFDRIDLLLSQRGPGHLDIAEVYLAALALGFEGKFREVADGDAQLVAYRRRLVEFLGEREPELLDASRDLVPEAYEYTLDRGEGRRLPYLRRWLWAGVGVVLLWVVAAHLLWANLISDMAPLLGRIMAR
jgi:type VI secretion system protein ImpK